MYPFDRGAVALCSLAAPELFKHPVVNEPCFPGIEPVAACVDMLGEEPLQLCCWGLPEIFQRAVEHPQFIGFGRKPEHIILEYMLGKGYIAAPRYGGLGRIEMLKLALACFTCLDIYKGRVMVNCLVGNKVVTDHHLCSRI